MTKISLAKKLALVIAFFVAACVASTWMGIRGMQAGSGTIDEIFDTRIPRALEVKKIVGLANDLGDGEKSYLLHIQLNDSAGAQQDSADLAALSSEIEKSLRLLGEDKSAENQELLEKFKSRFAAWSKVHEEVFRLSKEGHAAEAARLSMTGSEDAQGKMDEILELLTASYDKSMKEANIASDEMSASLKNLIFLVSGIFLSLGLVVGFIIMKSAIQGVLKAVAELAEQSVDVHDSSGQLTKTADLLSNSASAAAASIEETTASMEEISSMIKINTESGGAAAKLAEESFSKATTGKSQSHELSIVMQEIVRDSKKIEEILFVIDDISFQTNLLALNAAVEAARAGEQGKGFAVVAEAVRGLAQRSSSSAKEIGDLIKSSIERISKGSAYVVETEKSLTEIVSSVEKVMKINQEVASAGQEQSRGIQQIASAITEIDRSTQSNAAASEQVSASSTSLLTSADRFSHIVSGLRELVEGQGKNSHKKAA